MAKPNPNSYHLDTNAGGGKARHAQKMLAKRESERAGKASARTSRRAGKVVSGAPSSGKSTLHGKAAAAHRRAHEGTPKKGRRTAKKKAG